MADGLTRILAYDVSIIRSFWLVVHADLRRLARVSLTADFVAEQTRLAHAAFMPHRA